MTGSEELPGSQNTPNLQSLETNDLQTCLWLDKDGRTGCSFPVRVTPRRAQQCLRSNYLGWHGNRAQKTLACSQGNAALDRRAGMDLPPGIWFKVCYHLVPGHPQQHCAHCWGSATNCSPWTFRGALMCPRALWVGFGALLIAWHLCSPKQHQGKASTTDPTTPPGTTSAIGRCTASPAGLGRARNPRAPRGCTGLSHSQGPELLLCQGEAGTVPAGSQHELQSLPAAAII